jgi:hypothetical protein
VLSDADNDEPIAEKSSKTYESNYQRASMEHLSSQSKGRFQPNQNDEFEFVRPRDSPSPMSLSLEKLDIRQVSLIASSSRSY